MRPGNNNNRRGRNRGPRKPHGGMSNKSQGFDGGGSDTRVRGNVYQVLEKYLQLARDAGVAGDRVAAENFLQHADHYYRVITTMNDGQRPRVGGREISVADVNVQNVSQGLSAALYSGGPSQPNLTDSGGGNQGAPQGNPRGNDGFNGQNAGATGNVQGGNAQGSTGSSQGNGDIGQVREDRSNRGGQTEGRSGDGDGSDYAQGQQHRDSRRRGNQSRHGEYRPERGGQPNTSNTNEREPAAAQPAIPAQPVVTTDEQPEYPEHLLPPATEVAAESARAPREPRTPRSRLRPRRPRAAEGEGEDTPEPTPVAEGSE